MSIEIECAGLMKILEESDKLRAENERLRAERRSLSELVRQAKAAASKGRSAIGAIHRMLVLLDRSAPEVSDE